jgi:hypothetical protein
LAWHFGEASIDSMRAKWPAKDVSNWLAYARTIGGLTPLTAEQFCHGIVTIAQVLGANIKLEDVLLTQIGREQTPAEAEAALGQWDAHTKRIKPKIILGERIK